MLVPGILIFTKANGFDKHTCVWNPGQVRKKQMDLMKILVPRVLNPHKTKKVSEVLVPRVPDPYQKPMDLMKILVPRVPDPYQNQWI